MACVRHRSTRAGEEKGGGRVRRKAHSARKGDCYCDGRPTTALTLRFFPTLPAAPHLRRAPPTVSLPREIAVAWARLRVPGTAGGWRVPGTAAAAVVRGESRRKWAAQARLLPPFPPSPSRRPRPVATFVTLKLEPGHTLILSGGGRRAWRGGRGARSEGGQSRARCFVSPCCALRAVLPRVWTPAAPARCTEGWLGLRPRQGGRAGAESAGVGRER